MVVSEQVTAVPFGIESAILKLDNMNKRLGYGPCRVFCCGDGKPVIGKYNKDGSETVLILLDSSWHELKDIKEKSNGRERSGARS